MIYFPLLQLSDAFGGEVDMDDYFYLYSPDRVLDDKLYSIAKSQDKHTFGLETEERIMKTTRITEEYNGKVAQMLMNHCRDNAAEFDNQVNKIIQANKFHHKALLESYLNGSLSNCLEDEIDRLSAASGIQSYIWRILLNPDMYDSITRNHEMAKEIQRLVKENIKTRYFFAVGAAHLTYRRPTIQDLLEKEGYVIERIPPGGNV